MKRRVTEYWLYQHRYVLSYSLAIILIFAGLAAAALFVPSGLRPAEMSSAVSSGQLAFEHFRPQWAINLPYHLMQRASIELFGVGEFSIKLPSLMLGILAVGGMFLLIREWFRQNVAIITVLLTATLPSFMFIVQDGTPQIFSITVAIWLLLFGTYTTRRRQPHLLWKILCGLLLALNLYTPLGFYINASVLSTVVVHPHIRYMVRRMDPSRIIISGLLALIVLVPLFYSLAMQPHLGLDLLGIPDKRPDLIANSIQLGKSYVWQTGQTNGALHPLFSIGVLMITIIGFIRFLQIKYTARSYVIWLWGLLLLPMLLLNPDQAIMVLPLAMLMIAMGMNTLIAEWYKLFPYNPYARVLGLIPLSVLVVGVVLSAGYRYGLNYHYNPQVATNFSSDTRLLKQTISRAKATTEQPIILAVSEANLDYYSLVSKHDKRFVAVGHRPAPAALPYILSHDMARATKSSKRLPSYIAVNDRRQNSDRFYLYTEPAK